jgi:DNA-directed RNA polymerase subunit RPC12/RpoP
MIGLTPLRNLHSVMVVTLHVAVISYAVRSLSRPTSLAGSFAVWVPISILLALFLSLPMGRAISAAFGPGQGDAHRRCPRCGFGELRPLLRARSGLFQPLTGYRCAGCKTTYRQVGEAVVEELAPAGPAADLSGIHFEPPGPVGSVEDPGIRFLDDSTIPLPDR